MRKHPFLLCLILAFIVGCGPSSQTRPELSEEIAQQELQALNEINRGDFLAAANTYLDLAKKDQSNSTDYRLKAAAALYEARDILGAEAILTETETGENPTQLLQKQVLLARIALGKGDAKLSLEQLDLAPQAEAPANLLRTYHEVRVEALQSLGMKQDVLNERFILGRLPGTATETDINNQALWSILSAMNQQDLISIQQGRNPTDQSWIELALIYQTHLGNVKNLQAVVNDWSNQYPNHPAIANIIPGFIDDSIAMSERPTRVAVLLPMSGRFRDASRAIREGFVAAWSQDDEKKTHISFYNTDSLNVIENYQQALTEGADFIVGPLEKPAIDNLLKQGSLGKPTLALNYYDGDLNSPQLEHVTAGKNFFQFALSPENEAEQVAERAIFDGHIRALAITTGDEWGNRLLTAFQNKWQELGGVLLEHASYTGETEDFSEPIRRLLNTDESKQRAKELRAVLNRSIHSEQRRRQDADFIFIASRPDVARQVMPHIRFMRANELPVYATSHIYTGQPNPVRDADMNNIIFADIPWNLDPDFYQSQSKSILGKTWPQLSTQYQRLFALGYDAYSVIPQLPALAADPAKRYSGATGDLYIQGQGRLQRYLTWAKFVEGEPQTVFNTTP